MSRWTSEAAPPGRARRWLARFWPRRAQVLLLVPDGAGEGPGVVSAGQWDAWCARHAGADVTLLLGPGLTHELVIDRALPLRRSEVAGHARGVLAHYFGPAAGRGPLACWQAAARPGAAPGRGASLLREAGHPGLYDSAARHGVRLQQVLSVWSCALAWALHVDASLRQTLAEPGSVQVLVVLGDQATRLAWTDGQLVQVQPWHLRQASPVALLQACQADPWPGRSWALGAGLQAPAAEAGQAGPEQAPAPWTELTPLGQPLAQALQWLGAGARAPAALRQVLREPPRFAPPDQGGELRRWGWALAATAVVVAATSGLEAWQAWQARTQALALLQAATAKPPGDAAPPGAGAASAGAAAAEPATPTLRSARRRAAGLAHPWGELLAALERSVPEQPALALQWLSLEHEASRPELRATGVARDALALRQASERLAAQPGWLDVLATRQQARDGGLAFELHAQVRPATRSPASGATP